MVGGEPVVEEDCGLLKVHHTVVLCTEISEVELGLDVVGFVEDVYVGPDGLYAVKDVRLKLL